MCGACLQEQVDITEGIPKKGIGLFQVILFGARVEPRLAEPSRASSAAFVRAISCRV